MQKPVTSAKILSENLRRLMKTGGKRSTRSWAGDPTLARNISRIIAMETSPSVALLDEIAAKAGNLMAWHLLLPDLDSTNPPAVTMTVAERELYRRVKSQVAELPDIK